MIRPEDLNPQQREIFATWRRIGLTEAAALNAMIEDGVITLSDEDRLARNFQQIFGLSEQADVDAARGRGGSSAPSPPRTTEGPQPGDNARLIGIIESWAQDLLAHGQLCIERGETREQAALKEAFGKVFLNAQNDLQRLWISTVVRSWRPELLARSGSGSPTAATAKSGKVSETTKPSPSRPTTVAEFVTNPHASTLRGRR